MRYAEHLLRAAAALAACSACNSDPYVVASSSRDDQLPFDQEQRRTCEAGTYKGEFFTWPDSGTLSLRGEIRFDLVRVQVNGDEFTRLGPNTKLEGLDLPSNRRFSADVRTQYCLAGSYSTVLENGTMWIGLDADGNPLPEAVKIPFRGTIDGAYTEKHKTFYGRWETWLDVGGDAAPPPVPAVSGGWGARLTR